MKHYIFLFITFLLVAVSCKESTKVDTSVPAQTVTQAKKVLPPISRDDIISLYNTTDHIDYIFFDWDFSMNQSDANAVQAAVTFISDVGPTNIGACKAIGHLVFLSKGEITKEADLFYSDGCYFYGFTDENARQANYNAMTDQGIGFYKNMFAQALQPVQTQ